MGVCLAGSEKNNCDENKKMKTISFLALFGKFDAILSTKHITQPSLFSQCHPNEIFENTIIICD